MKKTTIRLLTFLLIMLSMVFMVKFIYDKVQFGKAEVFCRDKDGRIEDWSDGKKYCVLENGRWCELTLWYEKGVCKPFKCQCVNRCGDGTCDNNVLMCCDCDQSCYENEEICPRDCK